MVSRILEVLGVSGGLEIAIETVDWKATVKQHNADIAGQRVFPLAFLLKIMTLRPLTKAMFDSLYKAAGTVDWSSLEHTFALSWKN
jgi:hypothetical protein